jgi:hypothetical protein
LVAGGARLAKGMAMTIGELVIEINYLERQMSL